MGNGIVLYVDALKRLLLGEGRDRWVRRPCVVTAVSLSMKLVDRDTDCASSHQGKFYHRHRRPNDQVEYNTDPNYHLTKRRSTEELRRIKKKGMGMRTSHAAPVPLPDTSNSRGDSPLSDDDDDEEDEDIPLATRRSKQPSVNRIQSPDLSDPE